MPTVIFVGSLCTCMYVPDDCMTTVIIILAILLNFFVCIDPRVKDWLWMQSPIPTISLIFLYLLFVHFAPRFMKDRPPFEMKTFLFFFNAAIVILYIYLTREVSHFHIAQYYSSEVLASDS